MSFEIDERRIVAVEDGDYESFDEVRRAALELFQESLEEGENERVDVKDRLQELDEDISDLNEQIELLKSPISWERYAARPDRAAAH